MDDMMMEEAGGGAYSGTPPVMAYEFAETSGTTAYDTGSAGAGKYATLSTGLSFVEPGGRRALELDGAAHTGALLSDQSAMVALNVPFSIEALVYLDAYTDAYPGIIRLKTTVTNPFAFAFSATGSYAGVLFGSGASEWGRFRTGTAGLTGGWKHCVLAYDGGTATAAGSFTVYLNNSGLALVDAGAFGSETNENRIGSGSPAWVQWDGRMDFVRLYNYKLSASQVAELFALTGL